MWIFHHYSTISGVKNLFVAAKYEENAAPSKIPRSPAKGTREISGVLPSKQIFCYCIFSTTTLINTEIIPSYATKMQEEKPHVTEKNIQFLYLNQWKSILINLK